MRNLVSLALLAVALSPTMPAQARGGGRSAGGRRPAPSRVTPTTTPRAVAPIAPGAGVPAVAVVPVGFFGYYPNPLPADPSSYSNGYPPPPDGGPAPAYYGTDPSGQGYPSVLINPNYAPDTANPVIRDYAFPPDSNPSADAAVQPAPVSSVLFLIAMKDHTIYPAVAYWVEDDTLNYITPQGVRNRVSLGLVDRDFSVQLNKERSIDFALPNPKSN